MRQDQRFGAAYTVKVLKGSSDSKVLQNGHDQLSTYGILRGEAMATIRQWVDQLIAQRFLEKTPGEYPVLQVTDAGWRLLRGEVAPKLAKPVIQSKSRDDGGAPSESWEGVDKGLFETLRGLRKELAIERSVPPYVIFSDVALRDMARLRPTTLDGFVRCRGVGEKKRDDFGRTFVDAIVDYCERNGVETDAAAEPVSDVPPRDQRLSARAAVSFPHFAQGQSIDAVATELGRAPSTVVGYLLQFIAHHEIDDPTNWVEPPVARRVESAVQELGDNRLKPLYEALNEEVDYDTIRIVAACMRNRV